MKRVFEEVAYAAEVLFELSVALTPLWVIGAIIYVSSLEVL